MWLSPLFVSWIALATIAEGSPQFIPPEVIERMCRESEAAYDGPPMPRISAATFLGSGCPSPNNRLAYNYVGKWRCRKDDMQFVIPDLRLRAESQNVVKADCAISFHVDFGEGWMVALDSGLLLPDVELSPNSIVRFSGAASWEGGRLANGEIQMSENYYSGDVIRMKPLQASVRWPQAYSKCAGADGNLGNLTIKYNVEVDASKSAGYALLGSGRRVDMETEEDVDAVTLSLKWLVKPCAYGP